MYAIENTADISNVLPKGVSFKIGKKEYEIVYNFSTLKYLGDIYGSVDNAIKVLQEKKDPYMIVLNFLYAGLHDRYKISKSRIEEWIGPGSVNLLYNLVFNGIILSFGQTDNVNNNGEYVDEQGEAVGGMTLT